MSMQLTDAIIETLKQNGVTDVHNEAEVRACLYRLQWHPSDIDRAVRLVTTADTNEAVSHQTALHILLRTDERLRPETLSSLLGIELEMTEDEVTHSAQRAAPRLTLSRLFVVVFVGVIIASTVMLIIMWFSKVGLFHPTLWTY